MGTDEKKNLDILKDYLKDAIERIAQVMEEDFSKFLPYVIPMYLNTLDVTKNYLSDTQGTDEDDFEDPENQIIELGNSARLSSQYFVEMGQAASTLAVIISCTKKEFIPFIEQVTKQLLPIYTT